jgi:antitoxin YefM
MSEVTYSEARARFASLWDRIVADRDVVVVRRRGKEDLAMLPAAELASLMETAHLLRSPRNAERLLAALARAREGTEPVSSTQALREETGLG